MPRLHDRTATGVARRHLPHHATPLRPEGRSFNPLPWEFPGGRVEPGETDQSALAREVLELVGLLVEPGDRVIHVEHAYEAYDIDFCVYLCRLVSGTPPRDRIEDHRWVLPQELDHHQFPPADERSIALLLGLQALARAQGPW